LGGRQLFYSRRSRKIRQTFAPLDPARP